MHPAEPFHEADAQALSAIFGRCGLALIAGVVDGRPAVAHAPLMLDGRLLRFHLSAANRLCPAFSAGGPALAVVTAADAYVSPDWYGAPDQVPTWNYLSAEAEGPARVLDRAETLRLLDDLSARFEAPLSPKPAWTRDKLSPDRLQALLTGLVGFEMQVERLEGVTKLSQNKSADMAGRVARELAMRPDEGARAIAALMGRA